ncbi:GDSL-type esterase/lipase family protein [Plebeiibacterium sediminum]|uniref:GDSL-type esterase/lipase family protein n=1 Tax=Plebeiibacterium sediminum TaxID=2992112 RepID=A0AAE3SEM7_9BACT|nr:GDSL-type esterase/lipase family protein [Plebeiobacterium sediminum]MCW3785283.1 GDSL-type esterase/lipase family protein [Plebeiobacterium sediminum]
MNTKLKKGIISISLILIGINLNAQKQLSKEDKLKLYPNKDVVSRYHNDWTIKHYKARINVFKKAPLEFDGIVFIGNSITEKGRDWTEKIGIANIYNRGIAGDVTDGVLKRLDEVVYFKPKAVFILLGINDLFNKHYKEGDGRFKYDKIVPSAEYVGNNILKISQFIKRKSPETKIFVRTVLPTNHDYINADVVLVNKVIKENEHKGIYTVIDLYKEFADSEGMMIKELTVDGVHLSEKGYAKWVEFEKPIILSL